VQIELIFLKPTTSIMVVIAIAGGTSPSIGRAILISLKENTSHVPVVLTRISSKIPQWLVDFDVEVRKVDYASEDSLTEALKDTHTVTFPRISRKARAMDIQSL
jgi:hypothetical protein